MPEEPQEQQQISELAERVANLITGEGTLHQIERLHQDLMRLLKRDVKQATLESLLLYRGQVANARDREWSRVMSAIWLPDGYENARVPSEPYQLQASILGWQKARERDLLSTKYRAGVMDGFRQAYVEALKFGWGAANAGKSLEEVLQASVDVKPKL